MPRKKKETRGRPPLPDGEARTKRMEIRLNEAELSSYSEAAESEDKSVSEWVRATLDAAAEARLS